MKKRLLSLISVMALCFTAMPSYAVAEDTNDDIYEYELILSCSETHFYDDDDTLTYFYVDTDYEGDEITLIDADNLTEYTMVDDGKFSISGDDVPYDGVYSTRFELDTTMTSFSKEYHFYAFTEDGSKSNTVSVKITKRLTDVQIHEMSAVDEAVSNLKSGVEYSSASYDDKVTMMYKLLADLAENGTEQYPYSLIQKDSIKLSDDRKLYSYNYHFGMASSALIGDPSFQTGTTSTATITTTESSTSTTTVATTTETTSSTTTIETSSTTQTTTTTEETTSTTETTEPNFLLGDCNGDGNFGVSDVVLLQKWLLAVPDTHLADWKAGNFLEDDRLDVFDLCLMKRELIYGSPKKEYPVKNPEVIDEYTPYDVNSGEVIPYAGKFFIIIKCQYSDPNRTWTAEDFKDIDNIKSVTQSCQDSPYRTVLEITLQDSSTQKLLTMIQEIEALEMEEIKEFKFYDFATGLPEI